MKLFASHDWGVDGHNHAAVRRVVQRLREHHGLDVWMDETDLHGNILDAMCRGIDDADTVLVFVTPNYLDKVASGDASDNLRREFMYAARAPHKLVPVRFDARLPARWHGPVGMLLGEHLYTDLSGPCPERAVDELARRVQRVPPALPPVHRPPPRRPSAPPPRRPLPSARAVVDEGLLLLHGVGIGTAEHTGPALDRLVRSLCGTEAVALPLHDKIGAVRRHMGA
jgi:hypothetical protein